MFEAQKQNNTLQKSGGEIAFFQYLEKYVDENIKSGEIHPELKHPMDYYTEKHNMWIQYDGVYWHGKNKTIEELESLPKAKDSRNEAILEKMKTDIIQNQKIKNLIRFWEDDVIKAIKNNTIADLIYSKFLEKGIALIKSDLKCHQKTVKEQLYEEDKNNFKDIGVDITLLKAKDFSVQLEDFSAEHRIFIERYEWLHSIGVPPKWVVTSRYMGHLGCVILFNEPVSYSNLLGSSTKQYECLLQRGATASWTPKNLSSYSIMKACKLIIQATSKRLFVAYADKEAGEIGQIYQACGWEYLGDTWGAKYHYRHPIFKNGQHFSRQSLRRTSTLKSWLKQNGIVADPIWFKANGFKNLLTLPAEIKKNWYAWGNSVVAESEKIMIPTKGKYCLLLGIDNKEYLYLKSLKIYKTCPYPKKI